MRWMNLEPVIQSEVRKRKMNINISVNMESRKMILMNLFARQGQRHRHREQTCGYTGAWEMGCITRLGLTYIYYHV